MTIDEARQLLLREGLSDDGIAVCVRMGQDPGEQRLSHIAAALDVMAATTRSESHLDRKLMLALWAIAYHGELQAESWQQKERWRDGQFNPQLAGIGLQVEEFIAGEFLEGGATDD
jgi:hypothetical protein